MTASPVPSPGRLSTFLLLGLAFARSATSDDAPALDEEAALREEGTSALPRVLRHVDARDPDLRVRARRVAKQIALDFLERMAPEGMRLVPGRIEVTATAVRTVGGLYLGEREVTLREFRPFAARQEWGRGRWAEGVPDLPVRDVSLEEARAFARSRDARLPTLDELRHAATGGGRFRYPWGDRFESARVNSREAGASRPEAVGSRADGRSVHGLLDLVGNVAEWTETAAGSEHNRMYLIVGGSYRVHVRRARFVTYRLGAAARLEDVGFRLAKSLPAIPLPKGS